MIPIFITMLLYHTNYCKETAALQNVLCMISIIPKGNSLNVLFEGNLSYKISHLIDNTIVEEAN